MGPPANPGLIVNADDLGIHPRINAGIVEAFERGVLTSATMLMTTPYLDETLKDVVRATRLPVGLHLSLTLGRAVSPPHEVPDLVDAAGNLKLSAARLLLLGRSDGPNGRLYEQIRRELDAQLALARAHGVELTHVDSHQHVHLNPHIFPMVEDLAEKYGVLRVRLCREPFLLFELITGLAANLRRLNPAKLALVRVLQRRLRPRLRTNDRFFGLMYSGRMTSRAFTGLLDHVCKTSGVYEVGMHPGHAARSGETVYPRESYNAFIASPEREAECRLLTEPGLRQRIEARGIRLMSFGDLP